MASNGAGDSAREYRLIEQLELRIASANNDEKFENIIQKFLPALILKLASESEANRNLTVKVCQYVSQRLKISQGIQLPIPALLKNFKEAQNAFVRRFSLLFIQQGISRVKSTQAEDMLPEIIRFSVPSTTDYDATSRKMWSIAFSFLLDTLKSWKAPERGSKEDEKLKEVYSLSETQAHKLSIQASTFLLFDPKVATSYSGLDEDFKEVCEHQWKKRSQVIPHLADFLFTKVFSDENRLVPATILSVDANASASNTGDVMFKQCNFDLESDISVDALYSLYEIARPKLKTRILTLLTRSQHSTKRHQNIDAIVEKQLSSPETGLEAAKLTAAVFAFLMWAVKMSPNIQDIGLKVQRRLKDYVELQGWPRMNDGSAAETELRAKAYESIGLLAGKSPSGPGKAGEIDIDLLTWLFTSVRCDTTPGVRGSIEEALSLMMNAITKLNDDTERKLRDLLLWNVKAKVGDEDPFYFMATVNSTAYISVRFANKCLPFSDTTARLIDIVAMGVADRRELVEEGTRGLDPYWHASNERLIGAEMSRGHAKRPSFADLVKHLFEYVTSQESSGQSVLFAAAASFCGNILVSEALESTAEAIGVDPDWQTRIDALVRNNQSARAAIRAHVQRVPRESMLAYIQGLLKGFRLGSDRCAELTAETFAFLDDELLSTVAHTALEAFTSCLGSTAIQERAARCIGIVGSLDLTRIDTFVATELNQCEKWSGAIGVDAVNVRGHLLAATYSLSRSCLRHREEAATGLFKSLSDILHAMCVQATDLSIRNTAFVCLGQIAVCMRPDSEVRLGTEEVLDKLLAEGKKENERAVAALGRVLGYEKGLQQPIDKTLDRMYALHEVKRPEFQFALGESLAVAVAGFRSTSTMAELDVQCEVPEWGYHEDLMQVVLDKLIESCKTPKPALRKAAAIWLLCMVQYCGELPPVTNNLRQCQAAFARLLTDRDDIVQESGSRGLSIVYEKGDKALRDDLVRDLVQSFTGSGAKMSGTVDEDTQLFESGALPTENGQSVTTYKDIVSLATEMGDPSLVYKFMNLASNNAIWTSRAAFGRFGLSDVLADSSYLAENKKFYPKLFRYRFDPNPNVQRSMNDIWKALVKDPKVVIDQNFDLIMKDLLQSILSGKEWRARQGSCAAIADLVQGTEIDKLEPYLEDIWRVAFRVLDDVKKSVRDAAGSLCRTLTNMLIRNLEAGDGTSPRATTMLKHALPFLLQQIETGAAKEVQGHAIMTLLKVVKKSPARSLQPFAPVILETLVSSLSSLEDESINYLRLNAGNYGFEADELDRMRVSGVNSSPVTDAIDSCLVSVTTSQTAEATSSLAMQDVQPSQTPMQDAMHRLENTFKTAIGLPSKVGLSRVLVTLVVRFHAAFAPYADRFSQLIRKHILDRNATISAAFSTSLGYLMRLASPKEIQATSRYAEKLYFESQDLSHRAVAGEILQAISKTSNDVFNNHASTFLPFAFIGRNDTDEDVQKRFDPPWKDNIGGSRAIQLYLKEISALLTTHLKSTLWPIRHACCLAVADLVKTSDAQAQYNDAEARLIWPLMEEALGGKTWEGKEKVVLAYPDFVKHAKAVWSDGTISNKMKQIALREAKRTNITYRPHAIEALGSFLQGRQDLDMSVQVASHFETLVEELTDADAMDIDGEAGIDAKAR